MSLDIIRKTDLPLADFTDFNGCACGDFDFERDEWLSELDTSVSELLDVLSLVLLLLSFELDELLLLDEDDDVDEDDDGERFFALDLLFLRNGGEWVFSL